MKMIKNYLKCLVLATPITWISCNDKEPEALLPSDFENGVFITNEGNFGEADGSLSYFDLTENKAYNHVYSLANPGKTLGDVVQSIHTNSDQLIFIIVNNSHKVEALLPDNLESYYTIEGLKLPRYMASRPGFLYISEWVSFSEPGRIAVVDPTSGVVLRNITTDYGAEGLLITENKLFVSNNFSSTVSVIDLSSEEVIKTLNVGSSPGQFLLDAEGDVWIVSAGGFDDQFAPLEDGKLLEIDAETLMIKKEISLGMNVSTKISINPSGDQIYYFSGTALYRIPTDASVAPTVAFIHNDEAVSFYGLGIDPSGRIYLSDAKAFSESGQISIYEPDGSFAHSFDAGRGPNAFLFN